MYSRLARHCILFFFFFWSTDLTPPFSLLPLLSHPLSLHIHLSFTHLSLLPQLYSFSHFISTLFSILFFASFKILSIFPSRFSTSLWHVFSSFTHFLFTPFFITAFVFSNAFSMLSSFFLTFSFFNRCLSQWRSLQ